MKRGLSRLLWAAAALAVLAIVLWWCLFAPAGACFQLYDRRNEVVVLEIEHSFEHIPWFEYYTVMPDGSFNLDAIAVAGYGAGIPAEMDVPTRIENGLVWMEEINSNFPAFKWLTSDTYMKGLTLNGEEIFDFRTLPNASLIRGSIIMRRGCLSQWLR